MKHSLDIPNLERGGYVYGPSGTDKVLALLKGGDFVVPRKMTRKPVVRQLVERLNLNKRANLSKGTEPVYVSAGTKKGKPGEIIIPKEKVSVAKKLLRKKGKKLSGLAPDAEKKQFGGDIPYAETEEERREREKREKRQAEILAYRESVLKPKPKIKPVTGKKVYLPAIGKYVTKEEFETYYKGLEPEKIKPKEIEEYHELFAPKIPGAPYAEGYVEPEWTYPDKKKPSKFWEKVGKVKPADWLAAGQTAAGVAGLLALTGKKAEVGISPRRYEAEAEAKRRAGYGFEPGVLSDLRRRIELMRRYNIERYGTASAPVAYGRALAATSTAQAGLADIAAREQQLREGKQRYAETIGIDIAGREERLAEYEQARIDAARKAWATLITTGIGNIIGSQQFYGYLENLREIEKISKESPFPKKE